MPVDVLQAILIGFALVLLLQSVFSIYATLYAWDNVDRMKRARAPKKFEKPRHGFTVLLPARHEEQVIGETLRRLSKANYPKDLFELLVVCTNDDVDAGTVKFAEASIQENNITNARVIIFDPPPGKSKGMNIALQAAKFDLLTIFDSEDDVSADIFNIANTLFIRRKVDVLQCGVQLMDYNRRWFNGYNVLEYFFWFKSRMHLHAATGIVPLGGNTVFFRVKDLREVGGWDERGLCEDADIGIRLSALGKKFDVMYDAEHVTREECPESVKAFVKQRTRWNQGFLHILFKKDWRKLNGSKKLSLILYLLCAPSFMAVVIMLTPVLLGIGFFYKLPVAVSLLTFVPLFLSFLTMLISLVGLHEFGRDQHIKIKWRSYLWLIVTFVPYQILLTIGAARAVARELKGSRGWEKTMHPGAHRKQQPQPHPALEAVEVTQGGTADAA